MMSAFEGGRGLWKSGRSKRGCVTFILQLSSKCGQGGRGSENSKMLWTSLMDAPLEKFHIGEALRSISDLLISPRKLQTEVDNGTILDDFPLKSPEVCNLFFRFWENCVLE